MFRYFLFFCILPMMSCVKYMYINSLESNADVISLSKMWVVERDSSQAIRIQISKSSPKSVFIKWDSARIKIGDKDPAKVNVRPNHQISVLSSDYSVFEIIPLVEFERSAKFIYPKTYIYKPESLAATSQKVVLSIEVCEGDIVDGFRSMDCAEGSDFWSKKLLQGTLHFGRP